MDNNGILAHKPDLIYAGQFREHEDEIYQAVKNGEVVIWIDYNRASSEAGVDMGRFVFRVKYKGDKEMKLGEVAYFEGIGEPNISYMFDPITMKEMIFNNDGTVTKIVARDADEIVKLLETDLAKHLYDFKAGAILDAK